MSVEALLGSRAENIVTEIKSDEDKSGYKRSPVFIAASAFWRQGRKGLMEITQDLKRDGIEIDPEKGFLSDLPDQYKQTAFLNFTACLFGVSLIFNERALVERGVDLRQITTAYNWVFYDTFIPQLEKPKKPKDGYFEKLSSDQSTKLLELFDIKHPNPASRSLSRLYTDKIRFMPKTIKRGLDRTKTLPIIAEVFLPRYEWTVIQLITLNAKRMTIRH